MAGFPLRCLPMTLSIDDLMPLSAYRPFRREHQRRMMSHRRARTVPLGPHMRLQFEDARTLQYQVQEVLRAEGRDDAASMQHEIDIYAHLLPDGGNLKATLLIELPDAAQRMLELPLLNQAVHELYLELPRHPRARVQANEDLPDRHRSRPSAVHFLRFELPVAMRAALRRGDPATLGCEHAGYHYRHRIPPTAQALLAQDLRVPEVALSEAGAQVG